MPIMEAWRQRGRKKNRKTGTLLFLHARQSSKIQCTHRNGAYRRKACELVVLSIAEILALGAVVPVSGGSEHASPPEFLMREIHLPKGPGSLVIPDPGRCRPLFSKPPLSSLSTVVRGATTMLTSSCAVDRQTR